MGDQRHTIHFEDVDWVPVCMSRRPGMEEARVGVVVTQHPELDPLILVSGALGDDHRDFGPT
jgi:hypothetical protein